MYIFTGVLLFCFARYHHCIMAVSFWPLLLLTIRDVHEDRKYAEKNIKLGLFGRTIYIIIQVRLKYSGIQNFRCNKSHGGTQSLLYSIVGTKVEASRYNLSNAIDAREQPYDTKLVSITDTDRISVFSSSLFRTEHFLILCRFFRSAAKHLQPSHFN